MAFIVDETPWDGGYISEKVYCLRADNPSPMSYVGTNIYIVSPLGFSKNANTAKNPALIIDPAPSGEQVENLLACCDELGVKVSAVALTHSHHDHSEGACELIVVAAKRQAQTIESIPLYSESFTLTQEEEILKDVGKTLPEGSERVTFTYLKEGDVLSLGDDVQNFALKVIEIPGHSQDSLGYLYQEQNILFMGDVAFRQGPTVVFYPDGKLAEYMNSLDKLEQLAKENPGIVFASGHGYPIEDTIGCLEATRNHRVERLDQIKDAIAKGIPAEAGPLVDYVYVGVDPQLRPASLRSVEAQLLYLGY